MFLERFSIIQQVGIANDDQYLWPLPARIIARDAIETGFLPIRQEKLFNCIQWCPFVLILKKDASALSASPFTHWIEYRGSRDDVDFALVCFWVLLSQTFALQEMLPRTDTSLHQFARSFSISLLVF
jgi:hypothetical protein